MLILMKSHQYAFLAIILAAIFTGANGAFSKLALHIIPPITFTFFRFLLGSFVITPFFLIDKTRRNKPTLQVILLSLIMVINTTAFAFGIHLTTATVGQTLFAGVPILTALISYMFLKHVIGIKKTIGVSIGFIGTLLIIVLPVLQKHVAFSGNLTGNLLIFTSSVCLAVYSILSKQFHQKYSPTYLTAVFIYMTALANGVLAIPELFSHYQWISHTSISNWIGLVYSGSFGVLFFLLYQAAVKHGSALMASTINYLSPITAFIFAFLLLGEKVTGGFILGAILVLIGVFFVTLSSLPKSQRR